MPAMMDLFKKGFQQATGMTTDEYIASKKNENEVTARSGNNVQFEKGYTTGLSDNFKNALNNAVQFYQKEFKLTPRATVSNDFDDLPYNVQGVTNSIADDIGNFRVNLRNTYPEDEDAALDIARMATEDKHWAKNAASLDTVPTHEFGHVLTLQLLPDENKIKNLVKDSLEDIGVSVKKTGLNWNTINNAMKAKGNISGYAKKSAPETVAEALTDYYYNRDDAADLSKAIVKRLKNKGSMYALIQSGGVGTSAKAGDFVKNLRRYSAIQ